jgi:hypothetical protein
MRSGFRVLLGLTAVAAVGLRLPAAASASAATRASRTCSWLKIKC